MLATDMTVDALSASGRKSEKRSLHTLQSKMKCDPEGYETEVTLIYSQFKSYVEIFQQQAALNFTSVASGGVGRDPTVAKDLGDRAMRLANVTHCYPKQLINYPKELVKFLRSSARVLPSPLRVIVTNALIHLLNHNIVAIKETLPLFMELQVLSDKTLKKKAFSHVIGSIRKMNQKHKNETENRSLQRILFSMLEKEDENKAMRSLVTICDLYRKKVWFDDRTADAICGACVHSSSRIMIAALKFLLGYEQIEEDNDSDESNDEEEAIHQPVVLSKHAIYKAKKTGTTSSRKKKTAKLQRVKRSMKKQQRISSDNSNYYSPLNDLKDPQGFAEDLFSKLQTCGLCFTNKLMITKVVARTIGLHRLTLLKFYPFLQNYVQPHQKDVIHILAAAVQACHDMVPPDAVEPLFKQIVNQFVHDKSRTESIAVGLNVVREICLRMPLLMTEDLLQDLVLYKKSHEKAVSSAARSLISLFREICPSLLIKKDRGRPTNPKAKPKAFGEDVPGAELLLDDDVDDDEDDDVSNVSDGDEQSIEDDDISIPELNSEEEEEEVSEDEGEEGMSIDSVKGQKRKFADFDGANESLRALKRQATMTTDGIFSNEDFQRIKRLNAKIALAKNGFKVPSSDQLRLKRVDGYSLEANIRKKMTKEERKALIKAGREDGEKYQARAAIKQKKTGGLSNRQKEHKKAMPLAAKRWKVERSCRAKKMKQKTAGKQFRGRKAWK